MIRSVEMKAMTRSQLLGNVRRAVVKVGSSVLTEKPVARIRALAADIALLRQGGLEVVMVSSGSVGLGMARLDLKRRPRQMPLLQAASAVGQISLMQTYQDALAAHGIEAAQVLLSHEDISDRAGFLRARHTLMALLDYGVVPVINENNSVAVCEIIESDNDMLAAKIPHLVEADALVMLTTAEGIYGTAPRRGGRVIPVVEDIDALANRVQQGTSAGAGGPTRQVSVTSKVRAAQYASSYGVPTVVASGVRPGVLANILDDETIGTLLLPPSIRRSRKKWIADTLEPRGTLVVSREARQSLLEGNHSLLPTSVQGSEGEFQQGDAVRVRDEEGEFARGLVGYNVDELSRIQGKEPDDIEKLLGYRHYEEVIRRDDLVIL
jgi:glutamate 5-kinase